MDLQQQLDSTHRQIAALEQHNAELQAKVEAAEVQEQDSQNYWHQVRRALLNEGQISAGIVGMSDILKSVQSVLADRKQFKEERDATEAQLREAREENTTLRGLLERVNGFYHGLIPTSFYAELNAALSPQEAAGEKGDK